MKRTMLALLIAVGIFVVFEILIVLIGGMVEAATPIWDPNGVPSVDPAVRTSVSNWSAVGTIAGAALAAIGAVVFGLSPKRP